MPLSLAKQHIKNFVVAITTSILENSVINSSGYIELGNLFFIKLCILISLGPINQTILKFNFFQNVLLHL